ncbi:MAG: sugar ABC transporter permease [Chloroflexota bacterium]|nr:sugar ABC transporter permease [Chloroflexota bacterium]
MATQPSMQPIASVQDLAKTAQRERRPDKGWRPGETISAYLFLAPYLFVLVVFFLVVTIYGVGLSLYKVDIGFTTPEFVGLHYYQLLFQQLSDVADSDFWTSMINILKYTFFDVIGVTFFALVLAVLLHNLTFFKGAFRTVFYLPAVTSSVAVSLIFIWLYAPQGAINYLLSVIHVSGPDWLNDPAWALTALIIMNIWATAATFMIYFLAALQDIPQELIEAAEVDGANRFAAFINITLPLLRPAIFLVVALATIGAFQMFDQAKFMTNGGPLRSTLTPLLEIYNKGFGDNQFGYAAAMSVILFIVIFLFTMVQRRLIDTDN